jgi:hypothetical protein
MHDTPQTTRTPQNMQPWPLCRGIEAITCSCIAVHWHPTSHAVVSHARSMHACWVLQRHKSSSVVRVADVETILNCMFQLGFGHSEKLLSCMGYILVQCTAWPKPQPLLLRCSRPRQPEPCITSRGNGTNMPHDTAMHSCDGTSKPSSSSTGLA